MGWVKTASQHLGDWWCSAISHLYCHSYGVFRDRLRNWFWVLVWLPRPGYCPLTEYNPGMLTGLLTGHNTLRRDLYIVGLTKSSLYRRCWAEEETSAHVLSEAILGDTQNTNLGSFFIGPW